MAALIIRIVAGFTLVASINIKACRTTQITQPDFGCSNMWGITGRAVTTGASMTQT